MKRTFLAKRNALLSAASVSWGTLALAFALFALAARLFASDLFARAMAPAFVAADALAASAYTLTQSFRDAAALATKNDELASQNAALASENAALLAQVTSLSALPLEAGGIIAGVVARPPESPYDTLLIAAGSEAGVALGMEAFGEGGVPLGAVTAVTAGFARVTLFSTPGSVTRGWIGRASLPVDLYGKGAGAFAATVSRAAGVTAGDTVYASGPGMLPIGTVARVDSNPSSPSATLRITPAANPFAITWVVLRDVGAAFRNSFLLATTTL